MSGQFDQFEYQGKTIKAKPFKRKEPRIYNPEESRPKED